MAPTLILILLLAVIFVPTIVLVALGRPDPDGRTSRNREPVDPLAEGELPELLRRPLRAGSTV